ncbi:MAG: hypoxanthine phosphoribosyltransferase [Polyangiaceae bacterium]
MMQSSTPSPSRILYPAPQIAARVSELGRKIAEDYAGHPLVVLAILKGSFVFAADLVRAIELPLRVEFLGLKSYGANTYSSGVVQITQDLTSPVDGEDVLVVEDIIDTGLTLSYLLKQLAARNPRSVRVCSLLHKPARTVEPVKIDYLGFTIADEFVVGYGLDHDQRFRNLPYLGVIEG